MRRGENTAPYPPSTTCLIFFHSAHLDLDTPNTVVLGSETVGQSSIIEATLSDTANAPVGLSDPQYAGQKRRMLDAVNRLRATG